jgi:hypothetical protein
MDLLEEQKQFILRNWQDTDLLSLTKEVFNNEKLTGRSKEVKWVQKFLASRKLKSEISPSLTDSQKELIKNSIESMTPHEIAKIIFNNSNLDKVSKEVGLVATYAKQLGIKNQFPHEDYATEEYRPPDQLSAVVTKVNKYLRKKLSLTDMPTIQRKNMEAIRDFIHAPRFLYSINSYVAQKSRDMFEGEFIRTIFDKPDLTTDELNLCITLCQLYVMDVTLQRQLDMLNMKYEEVLNDPDGKLTQALSDMVKAKSTELKECNKTRTELVKFLSGARSERQKRSAGSQASLARLIEWFRDAQERKKALERAELQATEDDQEVKRLEEISETKARILGISKSELLHG